MNSRYDRINESKQGTMRESLQLKPTGKKTNKKSSLIFDMIHGKVLDVRVFSNNRQSRFESQSWFFCYLRLIPLNRKAFNAL